MSKLVREMLIKLKYYDSKFCPAITLVRNILFKKHKYVKELGA